jgi:MFS family permease
MIFAVAMTFIDQTIVSVAVPNIQRELSLSSTQVQRVVNGHLLALAALFAFGGRLSDIFGHTKLCVIGVVVFVGASIPHYVAVDFAHATSIVLYALCGVMAFAGVVALFGLERGRQEEPSFEAGEAPSTASEAA